MITVTLVCDKRSPWASLVLLSEGEYCLLVGDGSHGALGHVSVQTTERYLGCKQRIREAVNDHIDIEP